jgi:glycosyltransferase involved in cell wall biosynthesis
MCDAPPVRRVVLVHDYLTQRGGAERVVLAMLEAFPDARVVTSIYTPETTFPEFADHHVETLLPRGIPLPRRDPRLAFPILAPLFSRHHVENADVVVCSSSGWAHGIGARVPKLVYCHTPARWLYQPSEYGLGHGRAVHFAMRAARRPLLSWDARAAASADAYLANSTSVADRIRRVYDIEAPVVHPPIAIDPGGEQAAVPGVEPGFLLTIGRDRGYKNTAAVADAAGRRNEPVIIVGGELGISHVGDAELRWLYANCRALVAASYEDFGLTPVEAMAFGKPVAALRKGGYLDTVVDGVTGLFFDEPRPDAIAEALGRLSAAAFDAERIRQHSSAFSLDVFVTRLREHVDEVAT